MLCNLDFDVLVLCDLVLQAIAFRDVNPVAPKHILVIPRKPITQLAASSEEDIPVSIF